MLFQAIVSGSTGGRGFTMRNTMIVLCYFTLIPAKLLTSIALLAWSKAVDKWVLGDSEAPPNLGHFYLKDSQAHNCL